jgi:hypothetical protein
MDITFLNFNPIIILNFIIENIFTEIDENRAIMDQTLVKN